MLGGGHRLVDAGHVQQPALDEGIGFGGHGHHPVGTSRLGSRRYPTAAAAACTVHGSVRIVDTVTARSGMRGAQQVGGDGQPRPLPGPVRDVDDRRVGRVGDELGDDVVPQVRGQVDVRAGRRPPRAGRSRRPRRTPRPCRSPSGAPAARTPPTVAGSRSATSAANSASVIGARQRPTRPLPVTPSACGTSGRVRPARAVGQRVVDAADRGVGVGVRGQVRDRTGSSGASGHPCGRRPPTAPAGTAAGGGSAAAARRRHGLVDRRRVDVDGQQHAGRPRRRDHRRSARSRCPSPRPATRVGPLPGCRVRLGSASRSQSVRRGTCCHGQRRGRWPGRSPSPGPDPTDAASMSAWSAPATSAAPRSVSRCCGRRCRRRAGRPGPGDQRGHRRLAHRRRRAPGSVRVLPRPATRPSTPRGRSPGPIWGRSTWCWPPTGAIGRGQADDGRPDRRRCTCCAISTRTPTATRSPTRTTARTEASSRCWR